MNAILIDSIDKNKLTFRSGDKRQVTVTKLQKTYNKEQSSSRLKLLSQTLESSAHLLRDFPLTSVELQDVVPLQKQTKDKGFYFQLYLQIYQIVLDSILPQLRFYVIMMNICIYKNLAGRHSNTRIAPDSITILSKCITTILIHLYIIKQIILFAMQCSVIGCMPIAYLPTVPSFPLNSIVPVCWWKGKSCQHGLIGNKFWT